MTPLLSVIIACKDAADTLPVQLDALAAQDVNFGWEILLCDNGSTDATREVADRYRDRLPLRVVDAAARPGPAHARNTGAAEAAAPFLAFVDADDEVAPGWAAAMAAALRRHPFVAGRFEPERLNSRSASRSRPLQQAEGLQESPFGPGLPHAGAGNLGIARTLFAAAGGFDEDLGCLEDTDFCWRVQLAGTPLVFAPEVVLHVRLRSSLRGMWRQGRGYGAATAELEHRYGRRRASAASVLAATPSPLPVRVLQALRGVRSPGSLIWAAGWHAGHHAWRPAARPAPTSLPHHGHAA